MGYMVLLLAGAGGLAPHSPLKGSSTLERTHYIHLQGTTQHDSKDPEHTATREKKTEAEIKKRHHIL